MLSPLPLLRRPHALRPLLRTCTRHASTISTPAQAFGAAKPRQGPDGQGPPSATSTSAAQPFSTPLTPGPIPPASAKGAEKFHRSVTPKGTTLKNLNYFKNKTDPIAQEDAAYPEWLWSVVRTSATSADGADVGDLYSKSKKHRRVAKKRAEKLAALEGTNTEQKVPISEQTIDLPFASMGDPRFGPATKSPVKKVVAAVGGVGSVVPSQLPAGAKVGANGMRPTTVEIGGDMHASYEEAARARAELKKEMRTKGRAKIKEQNFLSQM